MFIFIFRLNGYTNLEIADTFRTSF